MPANLTTFVLKEAALKAAILKLSWQPGCVYVISFPLTQTLWQGEKPASDLASFQGQQNLFFSKQ